MKVNIRVENVGNSDCFVSVWDINSANRDIVVHETRLNLNGVIYIDCEEDSLGFVNLEWWAKDVDDETRTNGKSEKFEKSETLEVEV